MSAIKARNTLSRHWEMLKLLPTRDPGCSALQLCDLLKEILDYMLGYYSQLRPHHYNGGLAPNESERRYWLGYKDVAKIS